MGRNGKKSNASAAAKKTAGKAATSSEDVTNTSTVAQESSSGTQETTTTTTTKVMSSSSSSSKQETSSSSAVTTGGDSTSQTTKIVEVLDNGSTTKLTAPFSSVEYTVSGPPETPNPGDGKVHYIFGGTQISEVSSKDRGNRSGWDGKFTVESSMENNKNSKNSSKVIVEQPTTPVVHSSSTMESHASSTSSSVQKSSSSSYVVEIGADGKERIVDSKSREWGSSEAQSQAESFRAKSGTGIETEISYAAKDDLAKTKFDSGDGKGQKPIYEHSAVGSEHYLEQVGKNKPIEHVSEHAQNVSYDHKTDKFLTSSGTVDHKAALPGMPGLPSTGAFLKNVNKSSDRKTVIDSTSLLGVDKSASATSIVDQTERFINEARNTSSSSISSSMNKRNAALTTENMEIFNTSSKTQSSSSSSTKKVTGSQNVKDVTMSAITEVRRTSFDDTASNNTFIVEEPFSARQTEGTHRTDRNQSNWNGNFVHENANGSSKVIDQRKNMIDSTTTYTSKVFDAMTNTWRIVDETTVNERDVSVKDNDRVMRDHSRTVEGTSNKTPRGPDSLPAAGRPSVTRPRDASPTKKGDSTGPVSAAGRPSVTRQRDASPAKKGDGPLPAAGRPSVTRPRDASPTKKGDGPQPAAGKPSTTRPRDSSPTKNQPTTAAGKPSVVKPRGLSPTKRTPVNQGDNTVSSTTTNLDSIDQLDVVNYSTTKSSTSTEQYSSDFTSTINNSTTAFNQDLLVSSTPLLRGPGDRPVHTTDSIDNLDTIRTTSRVTNKDLVRDSSTSSTNKSTILKDSKTSKRTSQSTNVSTTQVYDEKTKMWREVDEKTLKTKRPSLVRYVSQEDDGTFTTTFKRKVYDSRSGRWNIVDEKVYKDRKPFDTIPEFIDDVTNSTTTTYTTKVYDTKTGKWTVVDEQKFVDRDTRLPTEIVQEIEKDHADIANVTTTTEITKVSLLLLLMVVLLREVGFVVNWSPS